MDDPRPVVVVSSLGAVLEQSLDERSRSRRPGGVDDEPGGLVDDEQVLVLPDDRNVDRLRLQRSRRRDLGGDLLPTLQPEALRPTLAVDEHGSGRDQPLGERSRVELGPLGEDAVEPRARVVAQERERGAVPTRGLVRSAATNEAKSSPTPTTMKVSARLNAGQ